MIIDLRSDTLTKPTAGMLDAMFSAEVGDDVFGEDPTVSKLELKAAHRFGMEAGLFCPSGTMTNQIAVRILTEPQSEVICDQRSHIYNYEGGGIAYNSLCSIRLVDGPRGIISPQLVIDNINEDDVHKPVTTLVTLENTVNKGGGSCYSIAQIADIAAAVRQNGLKLHLDGARVFNALIATGEAAADYGQYCDTISLCLSKGLGSPVGSVLLGSTELITKARRVRKVLGGGMRQAGYMAAAGMYAIEHHVDRLSEDHRRAKDLEQTLCQLDYVQSVIPVITNIVIFTVSPGLKVNDVLDKLSLSGIKGAQFGPAEVRFVTHLDFDEDQLENAVDILKSLIF